MPTETGVRYYGLSITMCYFSIVWTLQTFLHKIQCNVWKVSLLFWRSLEQTQAQLAPSLLDALRHRTLHLCQAPGSAFNSLATNTI